MSARPLTRLDKALEVAARHGGWSRFEVGPDGTVRVYGVADVPQIISEEAKWDARFGSNTSDDTGTGTGTRAPTTSRRSGGR